MSLFYVHNETGNVYTHVAGFVIFVLLAALDGSGLPKTAEVARTMFFVGVLAMAAGSSSYHLMRGMSKTAFDNVYACDLGSTVLMIATSYNWMLSLGFYCDPVVRANVESLDVLLSLTLIHKRRHV